MSANPSLSFAVCYQLKANQVTMHLGAPFKAKLGHLATFKTYSAPMTCSSTYEVFVATKSSHNYISISKQTKKLQNKLTLTITLYIYKYSWLCQVLYQFGAKQDYRFLF